MKTANEILNDVANDYGVMSDQSEWADKFFSEHLTGGEEMDIRKTLEDAFDEMDLRQTLEYAFRKAKNYDDFANIMQAELDFYSPQVGDVVHVSGFSKVVDKSDTGDFFVMVNNKEYVLPKEWCYDIKMPVD